MYTHKMKNVKVVCVGDGAVGKTSLLLSYTRDIFVDEYEPTVFDNHSALIMVDNVPINLMLWDTAGQEEYGKLRNLSYPDTDVFLVCFSVVNKNSYDNIGMFWIPEIKTFCPHTPIILCGTKIDLREDTFLHDRTFKYDTDGQSIQILNSTYKYVECSALTKRGVNQVFNECVRVYLMSIPEDKRKRRRKCVIS